MKYNIPFIKPSFPSADVIAGDYTRIVESNWFTNFGPYEKEFSKEAGNYIGSGIKVATVSNATLGLFIAIKLLFDESKVAKKVIVPSFTFAAGPEMLILAGYTPVLVDIDQNTWQPDLRQAKKCIEKNTNDIAGILLCNTLGVGNPDINQWEELASQYDLRLIIDSAAGFGSQYSKNQKVGARGDCEIFSLHATKPFAVGEGGLISSSNTELIDKIRSFENFGFDQNKKISDIGINAKLQEINAAIGLRQLEKFDSRLSNRRQNLQKFKEQLNHLHCRFQDNDQHSTIPFVSVVMSTKQLADEAFENLIQSGVEVRKYYEPLHMQPLVRQKSEIADTLSVSEDIYSRILSLPLHDYMNDEDMNHIIEAVKQTYNKTN